MKVHDTATEFQASRHRQGLKKETQAKSIQIGSLAINDHQKINSPIQAKLKFTSSGDPFEREADSIAERISTSNNTSLQPTSTMIEEESIPPPIAVATKKKRKCRTCQMKDQTNNNVGYVQGVEIKQKRSDIATTDNNPIAEGLRQEKGFFSSFSKGQPIEDFTLKEMESQFNYNFSSVKIHVGEDESALADSIDALAFTAGNNIVFAKGQYAPQTHQGRKLLAHELAHVVQQQQQERPSSGGKHVVGTIMRQQRPRGATAGCTDAQREAVENARRAAAIRCQVAYQRVAGIGPPPPTPGRIDNTMIWTRQARLIARKIFQIDDPDVGTIANVLERMRNAISSPSLPVRCASRNDPECGNRSGYVVGNRPPIHLCSAFFRSSEEQRVRTMIHEAAHLVGVGESEGETYCPIFDCESSCGGPNVADAWSHFIHCMSSQTPDSPEIVTPNGKRNRR